MHKALIVLASVALYTTAAAAAAGWTAPGWYQVADTIVGQFVWAGPFTDETSCRSTLPPNDEDADFMCEYLAQQPSWDT